MIPKERVLKKEYVIKLTREDIARLREMKQKQSISGLMVQSKGKNVDLEKLTKLKPGEIEAWPAPTIEIDWTPKSAEKFEAINKAKR